MVIKYFKLACDDQEKRILTSINFVNFIISKKVLGLGHWINIEKCARLKNLKELLKNLPYSIYFETWNACQRDFIIIPSSASFHLILINE